MVSLLILIFLMVGFIVGLKRGFILQLIHLTSFFIAFFIAVLYYKDLAEKFTLWIPYPQIGNNETLQLLLNTVNAENAYYNGIAFFTIFFGVKIILQIVGSMLDFVANIPIIKQLNIWAGGVLGFVETYLIIFILLYMGSLLPIAQIQALLDSSEVAKTIIEKTPIFSQQLKEMWFNGK
ncbi:CvpA family protein [Bacillus kwashiorkori]|uniref:CvpA family protein n=1 Tax=Bacillus kwashiorkori TaxID=1522318 RepID=UPI00078024D2|nr:CvpA family protein [Bacillus kwashiorkori]